MSKCCIGCGRQLKESDGICPTCGTQCVLDEDSSDISTESNTITVSTSFNHNKVLEEELGKVGFKGGALGGFIDSGIFSAISAGLGGMVGARMATRMLKTDVVHDMISIEKNLNASMKIVISTLSSMGRIIDTSKYSNYPVVAACCGSGFANMNPAVICVEFKQIGKEETCLHIWAYAKEGLIKQKTAIKAIAKMKSIISN